MSISNSEPEADVVVENFRPGAMAKLGLGYEQLSKINPRLVYCSISGFGSSGGSHLAGYDLIAQAAGGLMSVTGHSETGPAKAGVALVNIITGLHATMGIQTALLERHRTGEGQLIEVNLMSSVLSPLSNQTSAHILTGAVPGLMGNAHPSVAPYQPFEAADRPLAIAATTNAQFVKLVNALDLPQLVDDPSYSSNADRVAHVRRWSLNWNTCFGGRPPTTGSVCSVRSVFHAAPINDMKQAVELVKSLGLDPVVYPEGKLDRVAQVRNPISLSRTRARYRSEPPRLNPEGPPTQTVRPCLQATVGCLLVL